MGTEYSGKHLWDILLASEPHDVAERAEGVYDRGSRCFHLVSFGQEFIISPEKRECDSPTPLGRRLLSAPEYFFALSLLWYLTGCRNSGPSGELVRPDQLPGGQIYVRGTHVLPLEPLADRYGGDPRAFLERAALFGGRAVPMADAACVVHPFPRVPMTITLWLADEEFPARAGLFFDSTCSAHLAPDVVWATAMTGLLLMTE